MTKHVIKGATGSEPVIEWSMEVDSGGDLALIANGARVLWVRANGVLLRNVCLGQYEISGPRIDEGGRIKE